jgi:hypothetical protein
MVATLKKAFRNPDRAAFIFWLLEMEVTKDCEDNWGGCEDNWGGCEDNWGGCEDNWGGCEDNWGGVWRFKSTVPFFRQWASTAFRFSTAFVLPIALAL